MSSTIVDSKAKVEDYVKDALKVALEKRKIAAATVTLSPLVSATVDSLVPAPVVAQVVLQEGQKFFSDVFEFSRKKLMDPSLIFGVTCFHSYPWNAAVEQFIPEIDFSYHIDVDLASDILRAWELGEKVLCYGPTGAGKSSLIEQLCARTHRPYIRVNCTGDMDSSMIFGQLTAKDGSTVWEDGPVTEAVRHGAVFCWDEWDVTPPEISMGLQWLLEDKGKLFLKDMPGSAKNKLLEPHEHFRIVAVGNTQGQGDDTGAHAGTNVQNSATLDRFGTCIYVDYLSSAVEEQMVVKKYPEVTRNKVEELIKVANLVRTGYKAGQFNLTMSPRTILNICSKSKVGVSFKRAFSLVYLNKLNPTQRKVAEELWDKVHGKS